MRACGVKALLRGGAANTVCKRRLMAWASGRVVCAGRPWPRLMPAVAPCTAIQDAWQRDNMLEESK